MSAVDVVLIPPLQAELQEVVGEAEDGESFSSSSPSASTKSLPGTTQESSSLQVKHNQLMSTPFKRTHLIDNAAGHKRRTNVFDLLVQLTLTNLKLCASRIKRLLRLPLYVD